ncbi:hypothetical protein [Pedobacter sp. BMA]|uniref:hypothetical protein n=1 Tax=Pedobacter sp. BMA TaxID=1663685 RepID=UPI00064AC970|nr:hypothetical protein [Pedobacter sp. BMA]KLT65381.1 hypothetical protein AB669_09825 [Pedobacter sp. BMA]
MKPAELIIKTQFGRIYRRSLVSSLFIFFTDDSDGIMMFYKTDPDREPLSGYGAEESLFEAVFNRNWIWASEDMIFNIRCILEASS